MKRAQAALGDSCTFPLLQLGLAWMSLIAQRSVSPSPGPRVGGTPGRNLTRHKSFGINAGGQEITADTNLNMLHVPPGNQGPGQIPADSLNALIPQPLWFEGVPCAVGFSQMVSELEICL